MKHLLITTCLLLLLAGCTGDAPAESERSSTQAAEQGGWKAAYPSYFEDLPSRQHIDRVIVADISSDGIPEVLFSVPGLTPTVLTHTDAAGLCLYSPPTYGFYGGRVFLIEETNQLFGTWAPHTVGTTGSEEYELLD